MKKIIIAALALFSATGIMADEMPVAQPAGIALYPQQNECRNVLDLSGMWNFKMDEDKKGAATQWQNGLTDAESIAVPGSWNDQLVGQHNYLGLSWYEKNTYIPQSWNGQRVLLRVGSAVYHAEVYVNGKAVGQHDGGHLPFVLDVTPYIIYKGENRITISVENELRPDRIPTGNVKGSAMPNFPASNYDFFPFCGLDRQVMLYTEPKSAHLTDVTIRPSYEGTTGILRHGRRGRFPHHR